MENLVNKPKNIPKVIFIDEIDYLMNNFKTVEILRDLHDETDCPIIMIGMGLAHRKLERYKHLYDRFSEILEFETFEVSDIAQIVNELSQVPISADAIEYIHQKHNRFRQIVQLINKLETLARESNLTEINMEVIRQIIWISKN